MLRLPPYGTKRPMQCALCNDQLQAHASRHCRRPGRRPPAAACAHDLYRNWTSYGPTVPRPDARSSAPIAGARTRRHNVEGRDQGRQVTRAAITKECRGMPATRALVAAMTSLKVLSITFIVTRYYSIQEKILRNARLKQPVLIRPAGRRAQEFLPVYWQT